MGNSTRVRILDEALSEFACKGYNGTNLRDLAAALGLTKSALYRHFSGKEAIRDAVIDMMEDYYTSHFAPTDNTAPAPRTCGELFSATMSMLDFTLHDPKVILMRRFLLTEQFNNERVRELATRHFLTGLTERFSEIFSEMTKNGSLKPCDPEMLAFAYTTPISALVHLCDREPDKEAEIMKKLEAFIRHFISTYGTGEPST